MAGLVPAIHVSIPEIRKDVDARDKRGHDDLGIRFTPKAKSRRMRRLFEFNSLRSAFYLRPLPVGTWPDTKMVATRSDMIVSPVLGRAPCARIVKISRDDSR